ncbi:unnamed protein product [Allacma fusca]|uniref:Uncharacterized protein n=1 Tax=Allacma fusca TaxID=39272 RepID=A0A8J2L5D6_9HEXA|nr:unnamed protein product [Allacma fusca]
MEALEGYKQWDMAHLVGYSLKEKLWECVDSDAVRDQSMKCFYKRQGLNAHYITDMAHLVGCITPWLKLCANDDAVKEAKLVELWEGLGRSIQETHRDFWN